MDKLNVATPEEARELAATEWWKQISAPESAALQLRQPLLCMPFSEFHRCVEEGIGRPVWTHEFAEPSLLLEELERRSAGDGK